jgi:hypothetical protein
MECNLKNEICGFRCTGADFSHIWEEIHGPLLKKIDCESCHDHAKELFSFVHDVVNLGLGKPPFDLKNFNKMFKQIQCIHSHISEHGVE